MKVHACTFEGCDRTFSKREHLLRHQRSHDGSRPFQCDWDNCDSSFARSDALARHKRLHASGKKIRARRRTSGSPSASRDIEDVPTDERMHEEHTNGLHLSSMLIGPSSSLATLEDPLLMLSDASSAMQPIPPFHHQDRHFGGGDVMPHQEQPFPSAGMPGLDLTGDTGWSNIFDDVLVDFPLFQQGGEANAFLNSLRQKDYYGAAPSTFASPVATLAPSLNEDERELENEPHFLRIRNAEVIFEEVRRLSPVRPDADDQTSGHFDIGRAAAPALTDERSFDDVRAELKVSPDYEAVIEPSSSFLATSLQYFWRQIHPLFPVLHRPSFRTCDHHPLLLLAMCASGATAMATQQSLAFASAVFRRLLLIISKRWENLTGLRQRHDLLHVGLLTARYGLYLGQREWLSHVVGLHGSCLAYARQLRLFSRGGPYRLFRQGKTLPVQPDLWGAWVAHETSTRLANSILLLDDWVHTVVRDQQPPLAFGEVQIYLPSDDYLFDAPTAEQWAARAGLTLHEPVTVSSLVRRIFLERDVTLPPMGGWQQQAVLFAIYTQKRCRWMSVINDPDATIRDTFDNESYWALESWHRSFRMPGSPYVGQAASDLAAVANEALMSSMSTDLEAATRACGIEGYKATLRRTNSMHKVWFGKPGSRRSVLHAAQVIAGVVRYAGHPVMPFQIATAAHFACMLIFLYGVLEEQTLRNRGRGPASGPSFCLTAPYEPSTLGDAGKGIDPPPNARPPPLPLSPAAAWVVHGGDAHLFEDDPISTFAGRSMTLLTIAKALDSFGCPCASETAKVARCLSQAELE